MICFRCHRMRSITKICIIYSDVISIKRLPQRERDLVPSIIATCSHTMTSFHRHAVRAICGIKRSRALSVVFGSLAYFLELIRDAARKLAGWNSCKQEKIGGQRGSLPVQAFGYSNSTKVLYRWALERKSVFRNVGIKDLSCCKRLLYFGAWYMIFHLSAKFCKRSWNILDTRSLGMRYHFYRYWSNTENNQPSLLYTC